MSDVRRRMIRRVYVLAAALLVVLVPGTSSLLAQSVTSGALRGRVQHTDGSGMSRAAVTIEVAGGGLFRNIVARDDGTFAVSMMLPGKYNILVEVEGYQPVRQRGVVIAAGRSTSVTIVLQEKPPPITSVTEIDNAGITTGGLGRIVTGSDLRALDVRRDLTDLARGASDLVQPFGGWSGFMAAGGLPASRSRLFVDGLPEQLLRHPGVPRSSISTPAFSVDGIEQAQVMGSAADGEWRGVAGTMVSAQTRSGQNRLRFAPFASWSGSQVGGKALDNPGDSSASSFQVGATLSGALKPDTAHFFLRGEYQSLEMPSAFPWEADAASYQGQAVSLRTTIPSIGTTPFGVDLAGAVAPVVRTWKGGDAAGRIDWRLDRKSAFMLRGSFASWKEANAALGWDAGNDRGAGLSARDISAAISLVSTIGDYSNEARAGFSAARRDWTQTGGAETRLVGEGVRLGGNGALPGLFDSKAVSFSDAFQWSSGSNAVKAGVSVDLSTYRQDYQYGSDGIFQFGDLDQFGAGTGTYFRSALVASKGGFSAISPGAFLEDTYTLSSGLQFLVGLRWETQLLPKNRVVRNAAWTQASGVLFDSVFSDHRGIQPRVGFVLNPGNRGTWIFQGDVGLYASALDPAAFAEAIAFSGGIGISRATGTFADWPDTPGAALAPIAGQRLTLLEGRPQFHVPRTLKGRLGLTGALGQGVTLQVFGSYHHTDYLLRRTDLNRFPTASSTTQEGRPVYGDLVQQAGQISSVIKSSRRFQDFDLVSSLSPTGYSDHYEVTASLERQVVRSLSLSAAYTYSRTRDNLVGLLQVDPADQLSPFPDGVGGADWDAGRSDLDIPHRVAAMAEYRSGGNMPVTVAARGRWRSGLPFTPGFRAGVDVNGDLGGNNDPVIASATSGVGAMATCDGSAVGAFAARNSCRDKSVGALDLRFSVGIPAGGGHLAVIIDALNIVATTTGVIDHAAQLVDPAQPMTQANGTVTLPLINNPNFGTLSSRRSEPRLLRFGLRMEY